MGLNMRAEDMGPRLATPVVHGALNTEGIIDWICASFKLVWGPNYVVRLQHPVGRVEVTLPGHVYITPDFVLVDNHLAHLARCVLQGRRELLCDYVADYDEQLGKQLWVNASKKFTRLSVHAKEAEKRLSAPAPARGPDDKQKTSDSRSAAGSGRGYNKEEGRSS